MRRRTFIAALGAAAAWPFTARAEQRIPRIGCLALAPPDADKPVFEAFKAGLSELGLVPGKTIEIEARFADGDAKKVGGAGERARRRQGRHHRDRGARRLRLAHRVTDTVPIVMAAYGASDELVAMGIVASLAHPGGNVTGETFLLPSCS